MGYNEYKLLEFINFQLVEKTSQRQKNDDYNHKSCTRKIYLKNVTQIPVHLYN